MLSNNQAALLLLSLNTVPLGVVAYSSVRPHATQARAGEESAPSYPVLKLDGVLVQLGRSEGEEKSRYLAIDLDLEVEDDGIRSAIVQRIPRVRDSILAYFSDRTAAQLESAGALLALKDDLRERINRLLPAPRIRGVYVTQFIIQ